jgi:hypothetical protein
MSDKEAKKRGSYRIALAVRDWAVHALILSNTGTGATRRRHGVESGVRHRCGGANGACPKPANLCAWSSGSSHSIAEHQHHHYLYHYHDTTTSPQSLHVPCILPHSLCGCARPPTDHRRLEHSLLSSSSRYHNATTAQQAPHPRFSCPRHARHGPDAHPP